MQFSLLWLHPEVACTHIQATVDLDQTGASSSLPAHMAVDCEHFGMNGLRNQELDVVTNAPG